MTLDTMVDGKATIVLSALETTRRSKVTKSLQKPLDSIEGKRKRHQSTSPINCSLGMVAFYASVK